MIELGEIDRKIAARYMAMPDALENEVMVGLMDEAEGYLRKDSNVTFVCGVYDILENSADGTREEDGVLLDECNLVLPGKDIANHLKGCEKAVVMAATISGFIDTRIRTLQIKNMPLALVYDAMASVAIDSVCDDIQKEVRSKLPDYIQNTRFSPGYGDLPLELQPRILDILEAQKRAGISLTEGGMLAPVKSVTAIFGLTPISAFLKDGKFDGTVPAKSQCGDTSACEKCKLYDKCHS